MFCATFVFAIGCLESYELSLGDAPPLDAGTGAQDSAADSKAGSCDQDGDSCPQCRTNDDCRDRWETPRCDPQRLVCAPCVDALDCDEGEVCLAAWRRCTEACGSDDDCTDGDRPRCDRVQSACAECVEDRDCDGDGDTCVLGKCER